MADNDYENADKQKEQQKEQQINKGFTFIEIKKELDNIQRWESEKDQTVEEQLMQEHTRILSNAEENKSLLTKLTKSVTGMGGKLVAASGNPVQKVAPAKVSRKEQRRRDKETKIARETNPLADYRSYRISSHLIEHEEGKIRSISMYEKKANKRGISTDTLKAYCNGYKCNSKNKPLNKTEERKRNEDAHFLETYISGNREKRKSLLKRITIELLNMDLTENDFSEANLLAHHAEVKQKVDKIVHFKDIYEDELNRFYFDSLSQFKKDMIENLIFVKYRFIESMSQQCFLRMKVDSKSGEIVKKNEHNSYDINHESHKLKRSTEVSAANMKAAAEKEVNRQIKSYLSGELTNRSHLDQIANQNKITKKRWADSHTNEYRDKITNNPSIYSQKSDLMNTLYQKKYHGAEILFDVSQQLSALYDISPGYDDEKKNLETSYICEAIDEVKKKLNQTKELLEKEEKNLDNILNHLLKAEKLSDDAKSYMEDIEFEVEIKDLSPEEQQKRKLTRENQKITREVQKVNKDADYTSYLIINRLRKRNVELDNSTTPYKAEADSIKVDLRTLSTFCQGYSVNEFGEPIDDHEKEKQAQDNKFIEDYLSLDYNRRKPHFQRILKEFLSLPIDEKYFEFDYIKNNCEEVQHSLQMHTYVENMLKEKVNKAFIDELSPEEKEKYHRMCYIGSSITSLINHRFLMLGVSQDTGTLQTAASESDLKAIDNSLVDDYSARIKENHIKDQIDDLLAGYFRKKPDIRSSNPYISPRDKYMQKVDALIKQNSQRTEDRKSIALLRNKLERTQNLHVSLLTQIDGLNEIKDQQSKSTDGGKGYIILTIDKKVTEFKEVIDYLKKEAEDISNALEHLLTNKPLSESGKQYMNEPDHSLDEKQYLNELQLRVQQTKEVKKINSDADYRTYRISESVRAVLNRKNTSADPYAEEMEKAGWDSRAMKAFCKGYKANKSGSPENDEEEKKKNEDIAFFEAFISSNKDKCAPHFNRIIDEMLDMDISDYSDEYLLKHTAEAKEKCDKIMCFENFTKGSKNNTFLELYKALPDFKKYLINDVLKRAKYYMSIITNRAAIHHVSFNTGRENMPGVAENMGASLAVEKGIRLLNGMSETVPAFIEQKVNELVNNHITSYIEQGNDRSLVESRNQLQKKYTDMIAENSSINSENTDLVNTYCQKLYHARETGDNILLRIRALSAVKNELTNNTEPEFKHIVRAAVIMENNLIQEQKLSEKENETIEHILNHLILGSQLTEDDTEYMENLNLTEEERQQKKETKEVQKINKSADYRSYRAVNDLNALSDEIKNSTDKYVKEADEKNINIRILNSYCSGYKTDSEEKPINTTEKGKSEHDIRFCIDYMSQHKEFRDNHLNEIINGLLNINPDSMDFSEESILSNAREIKILLSRLTCIEILWADNVKFFNNLSAEQKTRLHMLNRLGEHLTNLVVARASLHGLDFMNGSILPQNVKDDSAKRVPELVSAVQKYMIEAKLDNIKL